jgi:hypothetical protein
VETWQCAGHKRRRGICPPIQVPKGLLLVGDRGVCIERSSSPKTTCHQSRIVLERHDPDFAIGVHRQCVKHILDRAILQLHADYRITRAGNADLVASFDRSYEHVQFEGCEFDHSIVCFKCINSDLQEILIVRNRRKDVHYPITNVNLVVGLRFCDCLNASARSKKRGCDGSLHPQKVLVAPQNSKRKPNCER